jgi:hypothetical protein
LFSNSFVLLYRSFKEGKRHGSGKISFPNVCDFDGQWVNDKMNGKGTIIYSKGDKYTG